MENVDHVVDILKGKKWKELSEVIRSLLEESADALNFEKAANLRDALSVLPDIRKKFGVEFSGNGVSDFFLFEKFGETVFTVSARFSEGKLINLRTIPMKILFEDMKSCIAAGIASFYGSVTPPEKIGIVPDVLNSKEICEVAGINAKKISRIPKEITKILKTNLEQGVENYAKSNERNDLFLSELSKFTGSEVSSIMCIDISTFGGKDTVAGAIWWENGKFVKKNYRKFKIRTIEGVDDFGSLAEVAQRLKKNWDDGKFLRPSLLLIDGGKGQISSVAGVLGNEITIAGIVKDRKKKKGREILINSSGQERTVLDSFFDLKIRSIRDESHRFSITFNRSLRKRSISTGLTEIEGIGKAKELELLNFFKSIDEIKNAQIDQLQECPGISLENARNIYKFFN
jgi:excinuclease ABC subunit C